MKNLFFILLLSALRVAPQSGVSIYEEGNYEGIKDQSGKVIAVAAFDNLGWSDGSEDFHGALIGYSELGKWGLLSEEGKRITAPIYDKLRPFAEDIYLVATKGKFTNRFFYGLINGRGKLLLNQDYFEISLQGPFVVVTELRNKDFLLGAFGLKMTPICPIEYEKIENQNAILIATGTDGSIDVFTESGMLSADLDRVRSDGDFVITTKDGFDGLISTDGRLIHPNIHKQILAHDKVTPFATWQIRKNDSRISVTCDSLTYISDDLWLAHYSGTVKYHSERRKVTDEQFELKSISEGYTVLRGVPDGRWMGMDNFGGQLLTSDDTLVITGKYFYEGPAGHWKVYNRLGRLVSDKSFEAFRPLNDRFIGVRKFGYWAILDGISGELTDFRYDDVRSAIGSRAIVKYVSDWGVYLIGDDWLIRPDYKNIEWTGSHFIGTNSTGNFLFGSMGERLFQTIDKIVPRDGYFELQFEGKRTALLENGRPISNTEYYEVTRWGDYFELRRELVTLADQQGRTILSEREGVQDVIGFSDGLLAIKKNGNYGFVDLQGNLRIANRYDMVKAFSEGMAAVKLRGKWGFVDRDESLVIQPHYQEVTPFRNSVSIYKLNGNYGFLSINGKELTGPDFQEISMIDSSAYILKKTDGKFGLADQSGIIRLSPIYDEITPLTEGVLLIRQGQNSGVYDLSGRPIIGIGHKEIKSVRGYFLIKD